MGIGLGGFVDGIVLHQILQWHHILTDEGCCPASTVGGLEDNTLADGFFHLATWIAVMAGTIVAIRACVAMSRLATFRLGSPGGYWTGEGLGGDVASRESAAPRDVCTKPNRATT